MSSAGMVSGSNSYWKGTDYIERKLGSVLDRKVASSTKQVLIDRIQFTEASKPDPFYTELKNKYTPLNNSSNKQNTGGKAEKNGVTNTKMKDELPPPKFNLFEREKIPLHWKTVRRVGPGLFNLGNTCFLNSVIQVLTYTPPLVNYLSTQEHSKTCQTVGFCMLCELQRHVLRTFSHSQNEAIKPMAILQKLKYIAKHLRFGHQEDSHEFLRFVIDGMLKSCLAGVPEKLDRYTKETTMVHQVFGGYFRSQVTCERCQHVSNTFDPLMEILLDIKHAHTVSKALNKLTSVELLNGDNMYLCPRCKRKVPAKKHLTVHRPPNVMTMCLKRFDCHSLFGTKLNKEVNYPDSLNLRPFMSKTQGPAISYKLYGVLVHSGYSCNSGHYYCFVKASNNTWYQMNDSTVRQVGLKTVLSQQAYLLFYIRDQHTPKEKPHHVQQAVKSTFANGVKPWKPEGLSNKPNTPKIINEPKKQGPVKGFDKGIGQPVPRKPDHSSKENHTSNKQYGPAAATALPQTREKVSFTLNLGTQPKRPATFVSQEKKNVAEKLDEQKSQTPETHSLVNDKEHQQQSSVPSTGDTEEIVDGKEKNSPVQDVNTREEENLPKQQETKCTDEELREKDVKQASDENTDIHATTKWKVTKNDTLFGSILTTLLPGSTPGSNRERTPSLSSDVSNACSIASKTGEWAVTDRSITQDVGPRLPERQHAGWRVSAPEDTLPKNESEESSKREKTPEKIDEDEEHRKPQKRQHSKEKSKKRKFRKTDDETTLLSDECRERSEDEEIEEKHEKKNKNLKKVKKEKKRKCGSSGHESGSSSESEKRKKRKKGHKKSKKKKKRRQRRSSQEEDGSSGVGELNSDNGKNKDINSTKIAAKAKELVNKVKEVLKNKKNIEVVRPLVQYSDHSSSGDENLEKMKAPKGSSDIRDEKDVRKNKLKTWSCGEMSSASGRSRDDRKRVVDTLLEKSRGTLNYGCEVERWDGEKEERVKNEEENSKRRRDEWDDEYDRGKTKRVKTKDNFRNRSYHGENSFQREHDRKRMRNDGWHYSPSSSSRWHNRSTDRHSRRDRR